MQAGRPDPGPSRGLPRDEADQVEGRGRRMTSGAGSCSPPLGWPAGSRSGRCSGSRASPATCGIGSRPGGRRRPGATCGGSASRWPPRVAGAPPSGPPRPIRSRLERLVRSAFRHHARYYLEVARGPSVTPEYVAERLLLETPELIAEAVVPGKAVLFVGLHLGSVELAVIFLAFQVGETVTPMETIDDPGLQAYFERTRGIAGVRLVGLREARRELTGALAGRHPGRPRRRPRPDRRRHPDPALRRAGDDADGPCDAGGRDGRADLRHDRPAGRGGPISAARSCRSTSPPTARDENVSRPR